MRSLFGRHDVRGLPMNIRWGWVLAALLAPALPAAAETPASDAQAVAIADQVMEALGGGERWNSLRGLRWSFGSEVKDTVRSTRRHAWDKHTGWHRVQGKNRAGQPFVTIENLSDGKGMAWVDGVRIEGDSLQKLLTLAKRLWTNDTYWFLMPYKLRDPGVTLKYAGEAKEGGMVFDKLALSFEGVGDTPGDHYWVYVNRANHRVEKWEYVLQGSEPPPKTWTWEGWEEHDGLWFCTAHRNNEGANVFTRDVETVREFRPTEFVAP
jgi:hypothetical protein